MLDFMQTPYDVKQNLKIRFRDKRLMFGFTQVGLSRRSGVSLGSLKRFENGGQISLESLLKLSVILECLNDFDKIAAKIPQTINSLDEILKEKDTKVPKKGKIK